MGIVTIHRDFKIFLDKVDSSAYPEFNDGEIDVIVNEAIKRITKQRYGGLNVHRTSFEGSQKRTDDLKNLVTSGFGSLNLVASYSEIGMKVYKLDLSQLYVDSTLSIPSPNNYMFFLKCLGNVCEGDCCTTATIKLVQQDDISQIKEDPFNKPKGSKVNMFFEDGDVFLWTSNEKTLSRVLVTYLKTPAMVNKGTYGSPLVECDLSEHLHSEIVQVAVGIALEGIESPRQNSQDGLNTQRVE